MDSNLVGLLIQIGAQEAPAIIAAVRGAGGTVQNVGPVLEQDRQTIAADMAQLTGELDPPPAP